VGPGTGGERVQQVELEAGKIVAVQRQRVAVGVGQLVDHRAAVGADPDQLVTADVDLAVGDEPDGRLKHVQVTEVVVGVGDGVDRPAHRVWWVAVAEQPEDRLTGAWVVCGSTVI